MKAQGMPMQTIALIIIIIIALAGVSIFFFVYFGKSKNVVESQTNYSKCKNLCMDAQSDVSINDCTHFNTIKSKFSSGGECSGYNCQIDDGTTSCKISDVDSSCHCP